jgi:two-component system OmpR family response regulator
MRILIVEDNQELATLLRNGLTEEGHAIDLAENAEMALDWLEVASHDVLIVDVLLPGQSGLDFCRQVRRNGRQTPILMLTALGGVHDRVTGLDAGADDYLVKPFAFAELLARLRALNRRTPDASAPVLTYGTLTLDPAQYRVTLDGELVTLTRREFRILEYLLRRSGRVATRSMIAEGVWDYDFPNVTNVIDVHIRSLRLKLNDPVPGELIQTIRGVGYRLGAER